VGKLESQVQEAAGLSAGIGLLQRRIEDLETVGPRGEGAGTPGSLNGTVRSKVLKMHRLGQQTDRIADSLRVPKGEVDLLVKVHQIVMRPYERRSAGTGEAEAS
jgi:hypothetical protein